MEVKKYISLLLKALMPINNTRNNDLLHTGAQVSVGQNCEICYGIMRRLKKPKPWYLCLIHLWW